MRTSQSLLPLLALSCCAIAVPTDHGSDSLLDPCGKPSLTLCNICYSAEEIYSTPAHLASGQGTIRFELTNSAVPYKTTCYAVSTLGPAYFSSSYGPYECEVPADAPPGACASFTFDQPTGSFQVNQTYSCAGRTYSHSQVQTYTAYAGSSANLTCSRSDNITPNWSLDLGVNYRVSDFTCENATVDAVSIAELHH